MRAAGLRVKFRENMRSQRTGEHPGNGDTHQCDHKAELIETVASGSTPLEAGDCSIKMKTWIQMSVKSCRGKDEESQTKGLK